MGELFFDKETINFLIKALASLQYEYGYDRSYKYSEGSGDIELTMKPNKYYAKCTEVIHKIEGLKKDQEE